MERTSEWFAAFREWMIGRRWWVQLAAWFVLAAFALAMLLPLVAMLLFQRGGSPIVSRAMPAVLILIWGFGILPLLAADSGQPAAQTADVAVIPQATTPSTPTTTSSAASIATTTEAPTTTAPTTTSSTTTTSPTTTTIATTTTRATTTTLPPTTVAPTTTAAASECHAAYIDCVPIASDVDCAGGSGNGPAYVQGPIRVKTIGIDPYGLDRDNDGIGCEG